VSGPVGVAVVGAGVISEQYLSNLTSFPDVTVHAVADLDTARAAAVAAQHGIERSGDTASVLALPEVELVLNLTIPAAHAEVDLAALAAGKHVYSEKPLALDTLSAAKVQFAADDAGLRLGCAPDTFLGAGVQSALRAVRSGLIGTPVAAVASFESAGPEIWHPSPEFLFQPGAGPLFDLGPYYFSALACVFGPASRVAAVGRQAVTSRIIGSGPKGGTTFAVEVPTHVGALVEYNAGAAASLSPDGKQLATADNDGITSLWDPTTGRITATLTDPSTGDLRVVAVAFSPDGKLLATADANGRTYLWNISRA
jgi:predicted dehydrogenase